MLGLETGLSSLPVRGFRAPPLAIDFVANRFWRNGEAAASFTDLSGASFARSGAGVGRTAAGGLIGFATGLARITDRGLLLEGARTNLLVRSQAFENASWVRNQVSVTANQAVAPDGETTADLITETGGASAHCLYGTGPTVTSGTTVVVSVAIKGGSRRHVSIRGDQVSSGNNPWITLDTQTGTIQANAAVATSGVIALSEGFWLVWMSFTPTVTIASFNVVVAGSDVATAPAPGSVLGNSYTSTGGTFFVWQADVQAGATSGSPIPTTTGAVTRGADVASVIAPANATTFEAVYGDAGTAVTGMVTPGAAFDLVAGRPWVGWGNELKRLVMT